MANTAAIGSMYMEGAFGDYRDRTKGFAVNKNLAANLRDMGVSMQFLGRDLMRTHVNNIVKLTFPKSKKVGVAAIERDLNKIFVGLDQPDVVAFFDAEFGEGASTSTGALKGKKRRQSASRKLQGVKFNWQGDQTEMQQWHQKHRNRNGRVTHKRRTIAKAGKWEFADSMYVPRPALKRYTAALKKDVATCKAGWFAASGYFARVTGGRQFMPAFVAKNPRRGGSFEDRFAANGEGYATATNPTEWASRLTNWVLDTAERTTERYVAKATKKQAEKIAERFNKLK